MSKDGILVIDKPENITSFKAVSMVRKYLNVKKAGHMGTLDPMATGVLPIMLGKATKVLDLIKNNNKKYITKLKFGISTDTQDITGKIIKNENKNICIGDIEKIIKNFIGDIFQTPPMYSAIKKNGVRLYELARKGQIIDVEKRKICINEIKILNFDNKNQEATLMVSCSKGTYIRALCSDIGEKLECGATMSFLRRIESNGFGLDKSLSLEDVSEAVKSGEINKKIVSIPDLFKELGEINISLKQSVRFRNGGGLMIDRLKSTKTLKNGEKFKIYKENEFIGLGIVNLDKNELSVYRLFSNT